MADWIDYKSLRAALSFARVLRHYKVQTKVKGDRAMALCPLPGHPAHAGNGNRTASLSVNLTRNIFQCFGCKTSGNVIDFCARMEGFDPGDPKQFRSAAIQIAHAFGLRAGEKPTAAPTAAPAKRTDGQFPRKLSDVTLAAPTLPVVVNAPLDFELKHLDPNHPYLASRGFTPETVARFGLGFCAKGMMKDRIAIPLHDAEGRLIGYAGRIVDDEQVDDGHPKYLLPGSREREGKRYEFHKSEFLYNGSVMTHPMSDLIVVEGFASVWWLWQNGCPDVVALMGSSVSERQAELLCHLIHADGRLWILTDGDEAGDHCAHDLFWKIAPRRSVRRIELKAGEQPTNVSAKEFSSIVPKLP